MLDKQNLNFYKVSNKLLDVIFNLIINPGFLLKNFSIGYLSTLLFTEES